MVPSDPTLHELAARPTPYLHTSRVCSTACEHTQTHTVYRPVGTMPEVVLKTNTDCLRAWLCCRIRLRTAGSGVLHQILNPLYRSEALL